MMAKDYFIKSSNLTVEGSRCRRQKSSVRIFGVYGRQRVGVNVVIGSTVGQVKEKLQVLTN